MPHWRAIQVHTCREATVRVSAGPIPIYVVWWANDDGRLFMGGGPAGDLYLEIEFNPHSMYRVDGKDVYLDLPVAPWEAALGGKVKAPTPAGVVDLTIPASSGQGRKLRLKGRGIPAAEPGDFYAVLQVVLPPARTPEAQRLYREMAEKLAFNPRQHMSPRISTS